MKLDSEKELEVYVSQDKDCPEAHEDECSRLRDEFDELHSKRYTDH
jgi:hypothetical protein